ncbi:MAG: hypothetical protein MUP70_05535 [Candidatus Aminicenantes bacterium]|nr:hypothetical protein [Candidatus Aminicenantes bacterium]
MFEIQKNFKSGIILVLVYVVGLVCVYGLWAAECPDTEPVQKTINAFLLAESQLKTEGTREDSIWKSIDETAASFNYSVYHESREEGIVVLTIVKYRSYNAQHTVGREGLINSEGWPDGPLYYLTIQKRADQLTFLMSANSIGYRTRRTAELMLKNFQKELKKRLSDSAGIS